MKYTLDYATRMPTMKKTTKPWNNFHGITSMEYGLIFTLRVSVVISMEYGQIFHVTRI